MIRIYNNTYKMGWVEESIPTKSKRCGLINSMEVPVIPKIEKTSQNWKLLSMPHLFFNLLNIWQRNAFLAFLLKCFIHKFSFYFFACQKNPYVDTYRFYEFSIGLNCFVPFYGPCLQNKTCCSHGNPQKARN